MKFLILVLLVAGSTWGKKVSTDSWDNDRSFTLYTTEAPTEPKKGFEDKPREPVAVDLEGPVNNPTASTTEDPIMPLILRRLLEDGVADNEVQPGASKVSVPSLFMTPPPPLPFKGDNDKDSAEETSTQSQPSVKPSQSSDDIEVTTASSEFDSAEDVNANAKSTTENVNQSGKNQAEDEAGPEVYAPAHPNYSEKSDKPDSYVPEAQGQPLYPKGTFEGEKYAPRNPVYLPKPEAQTSIGNDDETDPPSQPSNLPQTDNGEFGSPSNEDVQSTTTMYPLTIAPEEPQESTTDLPTGMSPPTPTRFANEQERPIYFIFVRPRYKFHRKPVIPSVEDSGDSAMSPPSVYYSEEDGWNQYPKRRPFRTWPTFIAQDYETQMPSAAQYYNSYRPIPPQSQSYQDTSSFMNPASYSSYSSDLARARYYQQMMMSQRNPYMGPMVDNAVDGTSDPIRWSRPPIANNGVGGPMRYYRQSPMIPPYPFYNNYYGQLYNNYDGLNGNFIAQ